MKVAIPRSEIRDLVKDAILYGKFYGGKTYEESVYEEYLKLFGLILRNDVVSVGLFYEAWFWGNQVVTAEIDLPKEKCSFYKKHAEIMRQGNVVLDLNIVDVDDFIAVLLILDSCEEFRGEPDERRTEFVKVFESSGLKEFVEYLLKHTTTNNLDAVHVGLEIIDAIELFKYAYDRRSF